jgi:hypothetical protein
MARRIKSNTDFNGLPKPDRVKSKNKLPLWKFIPKNIDFSYQKVISFSQYQTYEQCNYKWYKQSIEKVIPFIPNMNLVFGTAIHFVFQHYLKTGYEVSFTAADKEDIFGLLQTKLKEEYQTQYKKYGKHFSNSEEMAEFYNDGVAILEWFKKKRKAYFSSRGSQLVGIEIPLQKEISKNVIYQGYIDLVMYDELDEKITIYDLKTSTKGWNEYAKKDETKISQVLLYKQFFSELYDYPIEKIEVQFMILKRKAEPNEYQEFPKRIQEFKPASGKNKLKTSQEKLNNFIKECFDNEGKYLIKEHPKNITKLCDWCVLQSKCFSKVS